MAIRDRRSGRDRRDIQRVGVNIDVEWEGASGRQSGTISDISSAGCFVLSSGELNDGETVRIFLPLTGGMKVQFLGEVVNHVFEIGFAARFTELSEAQKDFLEKLVDTLKK
ncbi:MAG: PilZ domain protein [Acidobacteria bacterium]|jgi:hypothetical protein|nr:PilZ domain protein [Acidobacteriota bacterium]